MLSDQDFQMTFQTCPLLLLSFLDSLTSLLRPIAEMLILEIETRVKNVK